MILALLVGCALRRNELAELEVATIQQREGRWVLADLEGKGRRIRTVAIPIWVKQGIDAWLSAAGINKGRLLRSISKSGKLNRDSLNDWAVWSVVEQSSKQIGIEHFGAHDLRRTCAKLTYGKDSCWIVTLGSIMFRRKRVEDETKSPGHRLKGEPKQPTTQNNREFLDLWLG
ncbi:MAG: site-specific recombinase XerD [Edaphobacter sp.]|nr:site-specific recombinase XerD [Edaphobacter sp.]